MNNVRQITSPFNESPAKMIDIKTTREERSYALIANFKDGFALGWKMAVSKIFRRALDIRQTSRTFSGKTEILWTQGRIFDFHAGDVIYDTKHGYEEWENALKHLTLGIRILSASSSHYAIYETSTINSAQLNISRQQGKSRPRDEIIDGLVITKHRLTHGLVQFRVYRPNMEKTAVVERELIECTQENFVVFLQTGHIRTTENVLLNLFD